MRTVVIINTHSRRARKLLPRIKADFGSADDYELIIIRRKRDFTRVFEDLKSRPRLDRLIIGSGDGTITGTINLLRNHPVVYGIIPLGTCNTFAYNLGLSLDYDDAVATIRRGSPVPVALGEVNGKLFTCNAAIGVSTRVSEHISDKTKRYLGQLGYVASGLKELVKHDAFECHFDTTDKVENFKSHQILVANGHYHGHTPISKAASVYKNQLVLVSFGTNKTKRQHLSSMLKFIVGKHKADPDTLLVPFTHATLTTKPLRNIETDGEVAAATPAVFQVIPDAIKVLT